MSCLSRHYDTWSFNDDPRIGSVIGLGKHQVKIVRYLGKYVYYKKVSSRGKTSKKTFFNYRWWL